MFVKINSAVTIAGLGRVVPGQIIALTGAQVIPLIKSGAATPRYGLVPKSWTEPDDPEFQERKQRAKEQGQNVDWAEQEKSKRKPHGVTITSSGSWQKNESLESKIVRATKRRTAVNAMTQEAHKKFVEREDARYRPLQRRERSKGE